MRRTEHRQAIKQGDMAAQRAIHIPLRAESLPQIRLKSIVLCVAAALSAYPYLNANAQDLPTNPQVVGGAATITQSGNHQTVTQTTNRAIVNWGGFSIGANNSVNFIQPGSSSVILNRVVGNDPSSIFGSLTANGKVFLVNPNGIFFGAGSSIDTGGLVATTMSIRDNDFMSGYFSFERSGASQVENAGLITIREGGYALLAADQVSNTATGVINAPKGSVAMVSADRVTIETNQDGLVGFSVSGDSVREVASVDNAGLISADGGRIMLSARGAQELTGMVVNNSGTIRAQTVEEQDGAIILSGSSGATQSSGVLDASGSRGGNIQVTNEQGVAAVAGQLTATGSTGEGGRIVVAGQQTGLFANTNIDASGTQGGTVRVGGEYRGDAVEGITSQQTYVASSANIKADGTAGDGGSVVVWADDVTRYDGNISARGTGAGKGGDAEVSGKQVLAFNGTADLTSESGQFGELLLDPDEIEIVDGDSGDGDLDTAFGAAPANQITFSVANTGGNTISKGTLEAAGINANVLLQANNEIRVNVTELNMAQTSSGNFKLETQSGNIVFVNASNLITTQGADIELDAGGSIVGGRLISNGGDINLNNGGSITTGNLSSGGGAINIDSGAALATGTLTSANGNIVLDSVGNMTTGAISSGSGTVNASSGGTLTTGTVTTSNASVILASSGNMNINNVNSGSGTINLASSGNIHIRNIDTSQTLSLNSGGAITQQAATRIAANTVSIVNASTVNLTQSNFANNLNANVSGSSFAYKDANALTVNNVTVNNGAGNASLSIETGSTMTVAGNVSVTGTGDATNKSAAVMNLRATGGNITQNTGTQITATDNGAFINNTSQETHFAQVTLKADNGGVVTRNVSANSTNGRAQVIVDGRIGVTATSGSITATAASQPGVSIFSKDGNITTTNATIRTTQTREVDGPQNSKANPNKVVENVGGISIDGGTLNLGRIESRSTATSGIALFGIATASRGNTTFNQLVNTNADAGISASTTGTNALVSTAGVGLLQTKALALTGDRDKGFFRVKTDIESLTVLGGKALDLDNTTHGAGVLTISALGRISDATTDPNTDTEIPATNKPVGGVRIQSEEIELLSLENRSTNSYLFDGTQTSNIFGINTQQDLRLIANKITFIPGTIQTKADTLVQLRPLTDSRNMQLALANATIPANTTFYSGDQIVGFLNQFNPDSVMVIGGSNEINVYGGADPYSGNITVGSSLALADQISLGDMTLRFITNGRVFNNFAANTNTPISWINNLSPPDTPSPGVICAFGQACIRNMTTGQIFIKDSLQQGPPENNDFRDVVFQGTGSGLGGTEPTGNSATNTSDGGGDSDGGGNGGGGGGSGSNDNDSGSGGVNEPTDNPGGGGNDTTTPEQTGTTQTTNNPGQGTGNPGGTPGDTTDPTTPGGNTSTGTPQDSSDPTGDGLAGGGEFSGNDGSTGNTNTGSNTNTGNNNQTNNGGNNSDNTSDNTNNNTNNPTGGGTLSDGSTPGGNNNTQTGDAGNNNGFTGGGNNSNNDNTGTGSNNTNTAGTGGTGGTGGGTFSDGSGSTSGGTQVADGSGGSGSNSGGFTGGGSGSGAGSTGSGGAGNTGGGTFSDGSGTTPGGTQIADGSSSGSTGGSTGGSGGFSGGGSGAGSSASAGGGSGSSGGGTFSDGSGTTSGGTQVADGSGQGSSQGSGQSGSGQSGSSSSQGSGGTQGTGSQADAGGFSGGGAGTSGSQSAGNNSGGFTGGGSSSNTASSGGSAGSTGGATFSDGSGSGSTGGTMLADGGQAGGQAGGGQSTGQGAGSQGNSSSGQAGGDSGGFSGGASGAASGGSDDGSQTQTASNQQTGDSATGDGGSVFGGGASGGGSSDATQLAENTQEQTQDYPECGDEGQSVKQVSRAGQPNADIVQMKATGVRLRGDSGSLNQQRASCARATATN